MADNYLITGYWGEPHVTAENDRGINAATFGTGRFVLPVGEQFKAEYIGNNTIRLYDGKLLDNGAAAGIPAGEYVDLLITNAGQGMTRNDLIVFQYSKDASTLIESGVFVVISGEETSGTAIDPVLTQQDLLTNEAMLDQMALWRVTVSGTVISAPVQLFEVSKNIRTAGASVVEATSNDGVAYYATIPGVNELYAGLEITIIPNVASADTGITLDVNGLGAKFVRLPVSNNTAMLAQTENEGYFVDGRPVKLMYDPKYINKGAWVAVSRMRQSGSDLYGSVPVQKGGLNIDSNTTDEDKEEALENLLEIGLSAKVELWENENIDNEFNAKTITLDLSKYDGVEIVFYVDKSTNVYLNTGFIPKGLNSVLTYTTSTNGYRLHREFNASNSGIKFETATNTGGATVSGLCIPYKIYGIKGVQTILQKG